MVRVDEMGRIYQDLGVGEDGKQLSTINITLFGRRLLISGDLYNQACNEAVSIIDTITSRTLQRTLLEPVILVITKPIDLIKIPFDESILVEPTAYNNLLRTLGAESALVTPIALPSITKYLTEILAITPTIYKEILRHLNETVNVVPNIFRTWISTKMLTQPTYVAATAYKHPTHYIPAETVTLTEILKYGFYVFCNVVVGVACAMGNRSITHKLIESADMISEQMKSIVRIVEDEVVYILPTAYKQPKKALTDITTITDYIIKQPLKNLIESTVSVVDVIKFGTSQYCNEVISVVAALQPFQILKSCIETATVTATKTISLSRYIVQNVIITPVFHITINIFKYITQTIVVTPFINGIFTKLSMHTAVETVREVISKDTVAEIKSATVTKVLHAGTQIDSMKKAAITRLKSVTGVYKEGDEQR